jgi:hypothetical protein
MNIIMNLRVTYANFQEIIDHMCNCQISKQECFYKSVKIMKLQMYLYKPAGLHHFVTHFCRAHGASYKEIPVVQTGQRM